MAGRIDRSVLHRYDNLLALILGRACVRYGKLDYGRWAAETGMSEDTLRRRVASPEDLTLGELVKIARVFEIQVDDVRRTGPRVYA